MSLLYLISNWGHGITWVIFIPRKNYNQSRAASPALSMLFMCSSLLYFLQRAPRKNRQCKLQRTHSQEALQGDWFSLATWDSATVRLIWLKAQCVEALLFCALSNLSKEKFLKPVSYHEFYIFLTIQFSLKQRRKTKISSEKLIPL